MNAQQAWWSNDDAEDNDDDLDQQEKYKLNEIVVVMVVLVVVVKQMSPSIFIRSTPTAWEDTFFSVNDSRLTSICVDSSTFSLMYLHPVLCVWLKEIVPVVPSKSSLDHPDNQEKSVAGVWKIASKKTTIGVEKSWWPSIFQTSVWLNKRWKGVKHANCTKKEEIKSHVCLVMNGWLILLWNSWVLVHVKVDHLLVHLFQPYFWYHLRFQKMYESLHVMMSRGWFLL